MIFIFIIRNSLITLKSLLYKSINSFLKSGKVYDLYYLKIFGFYKTIVTKLKFHFSYSFKVFNNYILVSTKVHVIQGNKLNMYFLN